MRRCWRASFLFFCSFHTTTANLFSTSSPSITQDAVWIYSNSSSIAHTDKDISPVTYDDGVYPATNLTVPTKNGLRGILYDRSLSCDLEPSDALPLQIVRSDIPRIALIKRGNCSFVQKLQLAQQSGATAAIVYDSNSQNADNNNDETMLIPLGSGVDIPAYYVDHQTGVDLYGRLVLCSSTPNTTAGNNITTMLTVRVLILPSSSSGPNPWELTLMIVIALLAISFFASVGMHYHLWRKRRRQRRMIEQGLALAAAAAQDGEPKEKPLVNEATLGTFPMRVIKKRSPIRPRLSFPGGNNGVASGVEKQTEGASERVTNNSSVSIPVEESNNEACVICLDEWSEGDQVRKLPCRHEYHCRCIDPWLTSKSAECPLCKFNCASDSDENKDASTSTTLPETEITPLPSSSPDPPIPEPHTAGSALPEPALPEPGLSQRRTLLQRISSSLPRFRRTTSRNQQDTMELGQQPS